MKSFVAFEPQDNGRWTTVETLEKALEKQERFGASNLIWATTGEEGLAVLAERFPSKSGYPRVLLLDNEPPVLRVLPEQWAVVPATTKDDDVRNLLLARNRVVFKGEANEYFSHSKSHFNDLEWERFSPSGEKYGWGSRSGYWYELRLSKRPGVGVVSLNSWLRHSGSFYQNVLDRIAEQMPTLHCLYWLRRDSSDQRNRAVIERLVDLLHDWRHTFGKRNVGYRKLDSWKELMVAIGNQPVMRQLNRYGGWRHVEELLQEVVAAQQRHVKGVVSAKKWPLAQLLKLDDSSSVEQILHYKPPAKRRKHADQKAKGKQQLPGRTAVPELPQPGAVHDPR